MLRFPVSLRYAPAIAVAALCLQAAASNVPGAAVAYAVAPAGQHARGEAGSGFVPAASQGKSARQARMRRCLQSWDPATQMSKGEWRRTCQRVIIQQPGMFGPDPL
jgi:hypothetical protein